MKKKYPPSLSVVGSQTETTVNTVVLEVLSMPASRDRHVIYKDARGEWRWRRVAPNGQIVAVSGESYKNQKFCLSMVERLCRGACKELITIKRG